MVSLSLPARRRRPVDPRILIGLALIVLSALGTTWLVSALTRSVVVYRADAAIVAGERVTAARLAPTTVRLGDAAGLYLTGSMPADGLIATRTIGRGEIVPRSAVATGTAITSATIVVDLAAPLAGGVAAGSTVDLWSAEQDADVRDRFEPPVVLVSDAVVARVVQPTGLIARTADDAIELRIDRADVAAVLAAQADGARLSVVEVGGSTP